MLASAETGRRTPLPQGRGHQPAKLVSPLAVRAAARFASLGILDAEHAAKFAAVKDETIFHSSDFISKAMQKREA